MGRQFPVRVFRSDVAGSRSNFRRWAVYCGNTLLFDVEATEAHDPDKVIVNVNAQCAGGESVCLQFIDGEVNFLRHDKPQREVGPRHLYEAGELSTLCGSAVRDYDKRRTPTGVLPAGPWFSGKGTFYETVRHPVHVSKARKTDCTECRRVYRARIRDRRESKRIFERQDEEAQARRLPPDSPVAGGEQRPGE